MIRPYDPTQPAFSQAYRRLQSELEAIPSDQLEPIRYDGVEPVVTVLGVAATVKQHREEVRMQIGEAAAVHIDQLEDAVRAFGHAQAQYLVLRHGVDTTKMVEELSQQRRVLLAETRSLVSQKKLPASVMAELVGGVGQKALCMDVLQLVAGFRAEWASVSSITPVTEAELDHVEALANALATTLGENEYAMSPASPSAELRARAYTFFIRTYDEVRRAIAFVRWDEGDADSIAPSLAAGRTRRSANEVTVPPTPIATPAAPVTASPVAPVPTPTPVAPAAPAAPGMPGEQPFVTTP
jgi:hypothetical protein